MELEMNNTTEKEHEAEYIVTELGPLGIGKQEAHISYERREKNELTELMNAKAVEIIKNGWAMVNVTEPDDGCFDGRETEGLLTKNSEGEPNVRPIDKPNHERPLVAGGGFTTTTPVIIAVEGKGESLKSDLKKAGDRLHASGLKCGAHTASTGGNEALCGCGALDKVRPILENITNEFAQPIKEKTKALTEFAGLTFDGEAYDEAIANLRIAVDDDAYFEGSNGKALSDAIVDMQDAVNASSDNGKVLEATKALLGSHNEWFLTINKRREKTFSQAQFRSLMMHHFPGVDVKTFPQIFPLDAYRIADLVEGAVETTEFTKGVQAAVSYQLGAAAELTDGSLPVFLVE